MLHQLTRLPVLYIRQIHVPQEKFSSMNFLATTLQRSHDPLHVHHDTFFAAVAHAGPGGNAAYATTRSHRKTRLLDKG
jgi:hypothetical protein